MSCYSSREGAIAESLEKQLDWDDELGIADQIDSNVKMDLDCIGHVEIEKFIK